MEGRFILKLLFGNLINWIIIAVGIVLFFIFKPPIQFDIITIWVLATIGADLLWGIISFMWEYHERHEELIKHANRLPFFINGVKDIIDNMIGMDPKQVKVISSIFNALPQDFGGIVIGADESRYINILSELIPSTQNSFYATLRGGYSPTYTISWFFRDTKHEQAVLLSANEKQNYLKCVNEAKIKNKIRIVILEEREMGDFCNDEWRNSFFELNESVNVYWITPMCLKAYLIELRVPIDNGEAITIHEGETGFIWEDYAVFDERIVVKHDGRNSLYLGVYNQIKKMLLPFKLLEHQPQLFKKLDKGGIYIYRNGMWQLETKWDNWKRTNCSQSQSTSTLLSGSGHGSSTGST